MKLSNFSKSSLKNYTYLELMQTISERLTTGASAITNAKVNAAIAAFKTAVSNMDAAYKAATASPLTQPLAEADLARDRAYGSLSQIVSAMATSGVANLQSAAQELQLVLATFKVNTSAQYNEESGAILQLCQQMDQHTTALTTLGLTAVYAELKAQNDNVRTILKQRNAAQAGDQTGVMKAHRAIVDNAFNAMLDHINAVLCLDSTTALESVVAIINADINYVRVHNGLSSVNENDNNDNDNENTPNSSPLTPNPDDTPEPETPRDDDDNVV